MIAVLAFVALVVIVTGLPLAHWLDHPRRPNPRKDQTT